MRSTYEAGHAHGTTSSALLARWDAIHRTVAALDHLVTSVTPTVGPDPVSFLRRGGRYGCICGRTMRKMVWDRLLRSFALVLPTWRCSGVKTIRNGRVWKDTFGMGV